MYMYMPRHLVQSGDHAQDVLSLRLFSAKSPMIRGSFAENDLQLKESDSSYNDLIIP